VYPDSILTSEDAKVKKIAEVLWGDKEKEAWKKLQNPEPVESPE